MIISILTTFNHNNLYAQFVDDFCATEDFTDSDPPNAFSKSNDPAVLNSFEPVVYNLFFWGINHDDGTAPGAPGGVSLTEERALMAIQILNIEYNKYNIYFKYYGIDFINSTEYYNISKSPNNQWGYKTYSQLWTFVQSNNNQYFKEEAFNFYIFKPADFGGVSGGSYKNYLGAHQWFFNNSGLVNHEMGHCFRLWHTQAGFRGANCERVTRDPQNTDYNADEAGDWVTDTNAVPDFRKEHYWELRDQGYTDEEAEAMYEPYKYINSNCEYFNPEGRDCGGTNPPNNGTLYEIYPEDVTNIMSYAGSTCINQGAFTVGQGIRMREAIIADLDGRFENSETTIASLYEPYKGEYYVSGPLPSPPNPPLFQPGFNYRFVECCCNYPEPSDFNDITFSYTSTSLNTISKHIAVEDYQTITHPNHSAISIEIDLPDNLQNTRKCYDNWNKSASGGSVTKFLDNTFNTNIQITVKDSLGINNTNLINTLDPGLYKIEKVYDDGAIEQTIIQKDND